jgi:hypothetical protein
MNAIIKYYYITRKLYVKIQKKPHSDEENYSKQYFYLLVKLGLEFTLKISERTDRI